MNFKIQIYKGVPIQLIDRKYGTRNALRYTLNGTNQNVWIPKKHLMDDGTIKIGENIDYVFRRAKNQLNIAGIIWAIPNIKTAIQSLINLHLCKSGKLKNYFMRKVRG